MHSEETLQGKPAIIHSVHVWLTITMSWIYNQVKYTKHYLPIVFTGDTRNLDQFPWEPIYSSKNKSRHFVARALRKLRVMSPYPVFDPAVRKYCPRILHSHFGDRGWTDLPLVKKYKLRHIVTFYGYDVSMLPEQKSGWMERYRQLFERSDLFLCEGPHMANRLVDLNCPKEKIKVQRLGVEVDRIPFLPRKLENDGLIRILIAATFREKKGIPYALEAIGILKDRYPNLRVTLIGDASEDIKEIEEKRKIQEMIERYRLDAIIRVLGYQPYKKFLEEAYDHHIFLSPSVTAKDGDSEGGSPVSITELAASGMPIVSTRHCDIPEVVLDHQTGFLVGERDVEELSFALEKTITHPELWEQMGRASRKHIENNFNVNRLVGVLEEHYCSLR